MDRRIATFTVVVIAVISLFYFFKLKSVDLNSGSAVSPPKSWWKVQSVDTVKYSRDVAREKMKDVFFVNEVDKQVSQIAETGVTHIAIGTPYDDEFLPFMRLWVNSIRGHGINVWFRGNFSGWEGWFDYPSITEKEHIAKLERFILENPELFEDGDIFTPCTECENGGMGDPRSTGRVSEYRQFLIDEYNVSKKAFDEIGKEVSSNYFSMNADVAELIMDKKTTRSLGGIVTIDHYVGDPKQLSDDIRKFSEETGGQVVLGEFGAPIPDIHGEMSEEEQSEWLNEILSLISKDNPNLVGLNYWVSYGGSTSIWGDDFYQRKAAEVLSSYYQGGVISGRVINQLDEPIEGAYIEYLLKRTSSNENGEFKMLIVPSVKEIEVFAKGYKNTKVPVESVDNVPIVLERVNADVVWKIKKLVYEMLSNLRNR
jgi:hypothetical protein